MQVLRHVDNNMKGLLLDLQSLIRQPSVSAKNEGLEECARLVGKIMKNSGIKSEILYLGKGVPPVVYGEVRSKQNPSKTILFYNHYDVQPAEPFELWDDKPFSGKIKGNKIFGRGAADDKGELITRIKAVKSYLKAHGDVPCNVKFLVEGEEEIGSMHVEKYLKKYKNKLECDGVIWEFGYVDEKNRPIISLGMKGLLYVELSAIESVRDAHSSLAVIIKNPDKKIESDVFGFSSPNLDVVNFHRLPLYIQFEVFKYGKPLFVRNKSYLQDIQRIILKEYLEMSYFYKRMSERIIR
jgi:acetylornithine deacetylase/succinyl-diaminopimelate desuccinylase-like protein